MGCGRVRVSECADVCAVGRSWVTNTASPEEKGKGQTDLGREHRLLAAVVTHGVAPFLEGPVYAVGACVDVYAGEIKCA